MKSFQTWIHVAVAHACHYVLLIWQEIARLLMEKEKREYKRIREREKEKERERMAMERMAMERKRQEGNHKVTPTSYTIQFRLLAPIYNTSSHFMKYKNFFFPFIQV